MLPNGASNTLLVGSATSSADPGLGWWYAGYGQNKDGSAEMVLGVREMSLAAGRQRLPNPASITMVPAASTTNATCCTSGVPTRAVGPIFFLPTAQFASCPLANPIMPALATRAGGEPVGDVP